MHRPVIDTYAGHKAVFLIRDRIRLLRKPETEGIITGFETRHGSSKLELNAYFANANLPWMEGISIGRAGRAFMRRIGSPEDAVNYSICFPGSVSDAIRAVTLLGPTRFVFTVFLESRNAAFISRELNLPTYSRDDLLKLVKTKGHSKKT